MTRAAYILGRFESREQMLDAAERLRSIGFDDLDFHSPYPLEGASRALGLKASRVPLLALLGGLGGASAGYLMQWWCNAVDFPLIVGNRPPHFPPAFIPITFEMAILSASLTIFFGLMVMFRFPQPWHPVFEVEAFRSAAIDGYWMSIGVVDEKDPELLRTRLESLGAQQVALAKEPA